MWGKKCDAPINLGESPTKFEGMRYSIYREDDIDIYLDIL